MYENKSFQLAVLISMLLHFTVFISAPYVGVLPKQEPFKPIKVAYIRPEQEPVKKLVGQKPAYRGKGGGGFVPILPEALPEVRKEDMANPDLQPVLKQETGSGQESARQSEPTVETIGTSGRAVIGGKGKKFETVINEEKDSGKKSTYIGYYRLVREKIRYYADRNYIKEGVTSQGEIFLSFVVASNGELLHIMVIDNKSTEDPLLRNIAINSIRDASPFPVFPQGMNQYQITFNVIISFELNN